VPQDSGYGDDISVSKQYDTPCDKRHAQIISSPFIYSTPHIAAFSSPMGKARGTPPFGLLEVAMAKAWTGDLPPENDTK